MASVIPQAEAAPAAGEHGAQPPNWLVLPFLALLLMIATGPLLYPHHWHAHYPKYSVVLALLVAAYYLFGLDAAEPMFHALSEYVSFIALVASLFIAASGIFLRINARGTPLNNTILLFVASLVANLIATTGAAILFIRSYLRLNEGRTRPYHVAFFIFLVANVGGALTPIGDPPLFLGFLRGVPFFWTLLHVWDIWLPTTMLLLLVFYVFDARNKQAGPTPIPGEKTVSMLGSKNFAWVAVIVGSVFLDPNIFPALPDLHTLWHVPFGIREIIMLVAAFMAFRFANREAMQRNEFSFEPIREVAWLFLGIFATMQPALQLISRFARNHADSLTAGTFYWATGILSGVLDNAPTYLNFVSAAMGKFGLDVDLAEHVREFAAGSFTTPDSSYFLEAISVAAVFFGALTYIGNAPNFMVKAIAEDNGIETPSFVSYILRYSIPILIPIYFLIYLVFFSGWVLPAR
ncbi:MAG TPA: sodium:proton antiporter [Rhodothermales bacterium]|nr:sodium:proton antiporter [Rhodothermales bacterium]